MESDHLMTFQVEAARIFFGLKASGGYLVAGGAALSRTCFVRIAPQVPSPVGGPPRPMAPPPDSASPARPRERNAGNCR